MRKQTSFTPPQWVVPSDPVGILRLFVASTVTVNTEWDVSNIWHMQYKQWCLTTKLLSTMKQNRKRRTQIFLIEFRRLAELLINWFVHYQWTDRSLSSTADRLLQCQTTTCWKSLGDWRCMACVCTRPRTGRVPSSTCLWHTPGCWFSR